MKKTFTALMLGIATLFLSPGLWAQEQEASPREQARETVKELRPVLKLDDRQAEALYEVFTAFNINSPGGERADVGSAKHRADKRKIEEAVKGRLQAVLSEAQYNRYLQYKKKKETAEK